MTENDLNKNQNKGIQWDKFFRRLSPYSIKKGFKVLSKYGMRQFILTLKERFSKEEIEYESWLKSHLPSADELDKQRNKTFPYMPKISIVVPVYKTPETYLIQMIDSVLHQTYQNLELCIADGSGDGDEESKKVQSIIEEYMRKDKRVIYRKLKNNLGISENTNAAISLATGEFIGLLDHDDVLTSNALYEVVKALNTHENIDVIYTDEDKVSMDLKEYFTPHFKPDFNLDLLRSNNYICHFFVVRNKTIKKVGAFRKEFDGSQDYDFILRCCEAAENIYHIPKILYHWRVHKNSVAENPDSKKYAFDAGKRALEAHLQRAGEDAEVLDTFNLGFYHMKYKVSEAPFVSIFILNEDKNGNLEKCMDSINRMTSYCNYETKIIENTNIKEVSLAKGEYIVLLDNRTEVLTKNWLTDLLGVCKRPKIGLVSTKVYYPDDTIRSAGAIIGLHGRVASPFVGMPRAYTGYFHKASISQNQSSVTSSCVMIKKKAFEEAGGFSNYKSMDCLLMDLSFKLKKLQYHITYEPSVELYYYGTKEDGSQNDTTKDEAKENEWKTFLNQYQKVLMTPDPYYNVNLTLTKGNYSLKDTKN